MKKLKLEMLVVQSFITLDKQSTHNLHGGNEQNPEYSKHYIWGPRSVNGLACGEDGVLICADEG